MYLPVEILTWFETRKAFCSSTHNCQTAQECNYRALVTVEECNYIALVIVESSSMGFPFCAWEGTDKVYLKKGNMFLAVFLCSRIFVCMFCFTPPPFNFYIFYFGNVLHDGSFGCKK